MEINEEKRIKFMEYAGKRVNNVLHDIQILEPMARSNSYDFTKEDVEKMFTAIQNTLDSVKEEYNKKIEQKAKAEKNYFLLMMWLYIHKIVKILQMTILQKITQQNNNIN